MNNRYQTVCITVRTADGLYRDLYYTGEEQLRESDSESRVVNVKFFEGRELPDGTKLKKMSEVEDA